LPPDIGQIRASMSDMQSWSAHKTDFLIAFTQELTQVLRGYQQNHELLTVRNLFAQPVVNPASEAWFAQNLDAFLANYDFVALMAMSDREDAQSPSRWLDSLAASVSARPQGMQKTIFALQTVDWRTRKPVDNTVLLEQMKQLRRDGARNLGYYPDNFIDNHPNTEVLRDVMSLKETIEDRKPLDARNNSASIAK
jgi:biofilm PGA synthesis lipoprotein PgaB